MNVGTPTHATDDEKKQVKLNQQASGTDQMQGSGEPPTPPPSKTNQNIGVGTDEIGVEPPTSKITTKPDSSGQTAPPKEDQITVSAQPTIPPQSNQPPPPAQESKIKAQTDIPVNTYDKSKTTQAPNVVGPVSPQTPPPTILQPPIKTGSGPASNAPPNRDGSQGSPTTTIVVLSILAIIIGASGGFFGYRYFDGLKTSASTTTSPTPTVGSNNTNTSTSTNPADWQSYSNTKYNFSLKYPNGWVASTTDNQADNIIFASDQDSLMESPSGSRVEIVFQEANDKDLKSWVEANAVTTNEKGTIKEISVSGTTAFQQQQTNIRPAVATFISVGDKIMIVTLTAPPDSMSKAGDFYNTIINSIKLG